jgi:tetratricopeptide (TPR) repeat protein
MLKRLLIPLILCICLQPAAHGLDARLVTPTGIGVMEFNAGVEALNRGDNARAVRSFTNAERFSPRASAVPYCLGVAYYRIGKLKPAENALLRAASISPDSADVWRNLAALYQKTQDRAGMIRSLQNLVRLRPQDRDPRRALDALTAPPSTRKPANEAQIREYLKSHPNDAGALIALAGKLHARGDKAGALEPLRKASAIEPKRATVWANIAAIQTELKQPSDAIANLKRAVELDPRNATWQRTLGLLMCQSGGFEEGIPHLRAALASNPKDADLQSAMGAALLNAGDARSAVSCLSKVVELKPKSVEAWRNLAAAQSRAGDPDGALKSMDRASALDPKRTGIMVMKAGILQQQGKGKEATACLESLAKKHPSDASVQTALASAYASGKEYERARRIYSAMLGPEWKGKVRPAEVHARLAKCWQADDKTEEARQEYKTAFNADAATIEPLKALADTYLTAGDMGGAIGVYSDALGQNPPCWSEIRLEMADIEIRRKKYDAAADQCLEVIRKQPKMVRAHTLLAEALELQGDKAGALARHREIIRLSPHEGRSEIRVAMAELSDGRLDSAEKMLTQGLSDTLIQQQRMADVVIRELASGGGSIDLQRLMYLSHDSTKYDDAVTSGLDGILALMDKRPARRGKMLGYLEDLNRGFTRTPKIRQRLIAYYDSHGAPQKAEALYKRALDTSPKDTSLLTGYAGFLMSHSRRDEALAIWRKVLEIDPKNENASTRVKELEQSPRM